MKKAGILPSESAPAGESAAAPKAEKNGHHKKAKSVVAFKSLADKQVEKLNMDIERLTRLSGLNEKTNTAFAIACDERIVAAKEEIDLIGQLSL